MMHVIGVEHEFASLPKPKVGPCVRYHSAVPHQRLQ